MHWSSNLYISGCAAAAGKIYPDWCVSCPQQHMNIVPRYRRVSVHTDISTMSTAAWILYQDTDVYPDTQICPLYNIHCICSEAVTVYIFGGKISWAAASRHQPSRTSPIWQSSSLSDGSLSCQMAAFSNVRLTHLMSEGTEHSVRLVLWGELANDDTQLRSNSFYYSANFAVRLFLSDGKITFQMEWTSYFAHLQILPSSPKYIL